MDGPSRGIVESNMRLSAHLSREDLLRLSAKHSLLAQLCQGFPLGKGCAERIPAFAESIGLSAKRAIRVV
jgi:hypothetical protein